jgi:hypothetical protein
MVKNSYGMDTERPKEKPRKTVEEMEGWTGENSWTLDHYEWGKHKTVDREYWKLVMGDGPSEWFYLSGLKFDFTRVH